MVKNYTNKKNVNYIYVPDKFIDDEVKQLFKNPEYNINKIPIHLIPEERIINVINSDNYYHLKIKFIMTQNIFNALIEKNIVDTKLPDELKTKDNLIKLLSITCHEKHLKEIFQLFPINFYEDYEMSCPKLSNFMFQSENEKFLNNKLFYYHAIQFLSLKNVKKIKKEMIDDTVKNNYKLNKEVHICLSKFFKINDETIKYLNHSLCCCFNKIPRNLINLDFFKLPNIYEIVSSYHHYNNHCLEKFFITDQTFNQELYDYLFSVNIQIVNLVDRKYVSDENFEKFINKVTDYLNGKGIQKKVDQFFYSSKRDIYCVPEKYISYEICFTKFCGRKIESIPVTENTLQFYLRYFNQMIKGKYQSNIFDEFKSILTPELIEKASKCTRRYF